MLALATNTYTSYSLEGPLRDEQAAFTSLCRDQLVLHAYLKDGDMTHDDFSEAANLMSDLVANYTLPGDEADDTPDD